MDNKKKISIIADKLNQYLTKWRNEADHLNSFYYLSMANSRVYEDYLNNRELDENETNMIKEALQFKSVKFGEFKHKF